MLIVISVPFADYGPLSCAIMVPSVNKYRQQAYCQEGGAMCCLEYISKMPMEALQLRGSSATMQHLPTIWLCCVVIVVHILFIRDATFPNMCHKLAINLPALLTEQGLSCLVILDICNKFDYRGKPFFQNRWTGNKPFNVSQKFC